MNLFFQKNKKRILAALLVLSAVMMWLLYHDMPLMLDDLWYSTKLYSEEPIRSLRDVFDAQLWHYNNWGGRSVAHVVLQAVLLLGKPFAEICSVLVIFALCVEISDLAESKNAVTILLALCMLLGLNSDVRWSMIWLTGSANYPYMAVLIFGFLLIYLKRPEKKHPLLCALILLPLGLLAGWTNENMGPVMVLVALFCIIWELHRNKKAPLWMYVGLLSSAVGSAVMILAPGNGVRSAQVANDYSLKMSVFLRVYTEAAAVFEYFFPAVLLTALLLCFAWYKNQRIGRNEWILLACAVLSWGAMILSPHYPARAGFGTVAFLVCLDISLLHKFWEEDEKTHGPILTVSVLIWLRALYFVVQNLAQNHGVIG